MSTSDLDPIETAEWLGALSAIQQYRGAERTDFILSSLVDQARQDGVYLLQSMTTAYRNTIAPECQQQSPGDLRLNIVYALKSHERA